MSTRSTAAKILSSLTCALFTVVSTSDMMGQVQEKKDLGEFIVLIQTTEGNGIEMKCKEGCAWKTLTYKSSDESRIQAIDEYGMADLGEVEPRKSAKLADFLFTIQRTDNGVLLKAMEGTA